MTVIRPNSISGINSITANGGDINLFRADGTKADIPIVNNITAGVVTATKFVGQIDATSATFSGNATVTGNLGVGGVLTYEDVTNIDSIGIITARAGINVSGGTITGDGSGLTGVGLGTDGSANTSGIITATAFVPTTGQLSHRNIIINGAMNVAQRATSTTSNGYGFVDRFQTNVASLSTGGNVTRSQQSLSSSDTGPWQAGFRKYARMATVAAGTASAGSTIDFYTHIEAQDIANSGWDYTSSSGKITLSFWFRCSANQTFYTYVRSRDGTQQGYTFAFTASGNNTWTKITHTIPGNTNITFDNDNEVGLSLYWILYYGTTYTNNKTLNTWAEHSGSNTSPDMQSTWLTSGAATWDITGVQLEVGPVATPFEHRSFGDELLRCQRYCYADRGSDDYHAVAQGHFNGSSTGITMLYTPVCMRAAPTLSYPVGTWIVSGDSGTLNQSNIYPTDNIAEVNAFQIRTAISGGQSGEGFLLRTSSAGHTWILDAEL